MPERATLKLDAGDTVRVEVNREDLERDEIVVRRAANGAPPAQVDLLSVVDAHLADAVPHAAGTTDRHLAADRVRPY